MIEVENFSFISFQEAYKSFNPKERHIMELSFDKKAPDEVLEEVCKALKESVEENTGKKGSNFSKDFYFNTEMKTTETRKKIIVTCNSIFVLKCLEEALEMEANKK